MEDRKISKLVYACRFECRSAWLQAVGGGGGGGGVAV